MVEDGLMFTKTSAEPEKTKSAETFTADANVTFGYMHCFLTQVIFGLFALLEDATLLLELLKFENCRKSYKIKTFSKATFFI